MFSFLFVLVIEKEFRIRKTNRIFIIVIFLLMNEFDESFIQHFEIWPHSLFKLFIGKD